MSNATQRKAAATETPDWFKETPDDTSYELTMYEPGGGSIQNIAVSRAEYIALKRYLGGMRGLGFDEQLAELKGEQEDIQQGAFALDSAREALEKYPALISAPEFPPELQQYLITEKESDHG